MRRVRSAYIKYQGKVGKHWYLFTDTICSTHAIEAKASNPDNSNQAIVIESDGDNNEQQAAAMPERATLQAAIILASKAAQSSPSEDITGDLRAQ